MKLTILLLSIFSSSTYANSLKPESVTRSITLPMTQVGTSTDNVTVEERLSILQDRVSRVGRKYGYTVLPPVEEESKLNARARGSLQMGDGPSDFIYFASVVVGTPGVSFEVQLDTGSSDLILISNPCYSGCTNSTPVYRPSDSSTAQVSNQPFTIEYGSGAATGKLVRDVVSFGNFKINQIFGALQNSQGIYHSSGGISGILGLAFGSIAQSGATPFIQALYEAGALDQPLFSMAFARWKSNSVNPGGIMTIGAVDTTLYTGNITYTASSASDYWEIPLDGVSLNGNSLGISSTDTLIDSGTSLIYFPQAEATLFYSRISGSNEAGGGIWRYPCAAVPVLGLTFGGRLWNVSVTDFNLGYATSDGRLCYGAVAYFQGADSLWIFGDVFLKNVYSVFQFNPSSIGFATLANPSALRNGFVPTGTGITIGQGGNNTSIISSSSSTLSTAAISSSSTAALMASSTSLKSSTSSSSPQSSSTPTTSKSTTTMSTTISAISSVSPSSSKPMMGGAAPSSSSTSSSISTRSITITTTTTTTSFSTQASNTSRVALYAPSSSAITTATNSSRTVTPSTIATTSTSPTSSISFYSITSKSSVTSTTTNSTIKSSTSSSTTSKTITSSTASTASASTANAKVAATGPVPSSGSMITSSSKTSTAVTPSSTSSSLSKSTTTIILTSSTKTVTTSTSTSAIISRSSAVNANAKVGTSTTSTSSTTASIKTYTFTSTYSGHTYTSTVTSTSSSSSTTTSTTIKPTNTIVSPKRRSGKYRHMIVV